MGIETTPALVVGLLMGALIALALWAWMMHAGTRLLRCDAARYAWLRRQEWMRDGAVMWPHDVDRLADAGRLRDAIERYAA